MSNSPDLNASDTSAAVEISGKIMVAAIIVLFMVIVFILFLHLYARWYWNRRAGNVGGVYPSRSRRRFVFANQDPAAAALHRGLESSVLESLPVVFHADEFKDGIECAVCLSQVVEGEKARLLPKCNHGFHLECIDMWFQSHTTCPLCRNAVGGVESPNTSPSQEGTQSEDSSAESMDIPTNVLFWGSENQVSRGAAGAEEVPPSSSSWSSSYSSGTNSGQDGMLVIEIPNQWTEGFPSVSSEEVKTPTPTRLRALQMLLSREKRVVPPSPTSVDVEQGQVGKGQSSKTSSLQIAGS